MLYRMTRAMLGIDSRTRDCHIHNFSAILLLGGGFERPASGPAGDRAKFPPCVDRLLAPTPSGIWEGASRAVSPPESNAACHAGTDGEERQNNGEGLETAEGEKRRERERENESSIAQVPWNAMEQQRGSRSDLSHDTNNNGFPFLSFLSDSLFGGAIAPRMLNFVAEPSREFCCRLRLLYLLD